jgi:hypothetical protein
MSVPWGAGLTHHISMLAGLDRLKFKFLLDI